MNQDILKRAFDLTVTSLLLLLLSPVFLLIAFLIRLESRGPVFYSQPRVGKDYKVFPFFKFRSMKVNADKMVQSMKDLNHYGGDDNQLVFEEGDMEDIRVGDDGIVSEQEYRHAVEQEQDNAFFKVKNDPRITKVGRFIRKTSIDELPQLVNVLRGEMSLVGNRPLPLYEAEKLTSDEFIGRFMAPAGITGLWQVTERGKDSSTNDSRKRLDIEYSQKRNFWLDIKILIKTPLAAIQHENV